MRDYFAGLKTAAERCLFYGEMVKEWHEFEFQLVLLSMYFDPDAEYVFNELSTLVIRHTPNNFYDEFALMPLTELGIQRRGSLPSFLKQFLNKSAGLKDLPFGTDSNNNNPDIHGLTKWLAIAFRDASKVNEIFLVLLHYHRYWLSECTRPYNYTKAIILLNKLNAAIDSIPPDAFKVNLSNVLERLKFTLSEMLANSINCPFIDDTSSALNRNGTIDKWYLHQLNQFNFLLERNALFYEDFNLKRIPWIFERCRTIDDRLVSDYQKIVCDQFLNGRGVDAEEYSFLQSFSSSDELVSQRKTRELYERILEVNYLYELAK
ncbi:MAG TPA: hypothetical protein VK658_26145 [Chryseolinea sp.]|nr:hypothetical protein [Chryseolinea sp.]